MTLTEARKVLERYNNWRKYDGPLEQSPTQPEPKEIGEAIDVAIEILPKESTRPSAEERLLEIRMAIKGLIDYDPFLERRRYRTGVTWRNCAYLQMRKEGYTFEEIGKASGYDHSTIFAGCAKLHQYLEIGDAITRSVYDKFASII